MTKIKIHISKVKSPFYPLYEVKCVLQNGVSTLGYTNSNRPSKPNLPNASKPSKLFAPTRLSLTVSSLAFRIPQISPLHQPNKLVISELLPKHQITSSQIWVWWDKDLAKEPLKGMLMERVREEEFENQRYNIVDESILLFSRVSLSKFSLEALYISWVLRYLY